MTLATEIDERIEKCQKILEVDPNSQIFAALAEAFRKRGDLDKAFRVCQNGLKIHPTYGSAHIVMAKINLDRGLYDWAEAEVKKATEIDGNSRNVELLLAEIYLYRSEFDEAIKLLKRLHNHDPNNEHIKNLLDIASKIPAEKQAEAEKQKAAEAQLAPPSVPDQAKEEPVEITEYGLTQVLRLVVALENITGVAYANPEGLVIDSIWSTEFNIDTSSAAMADLMGAQGIDISAIGLGLVDSILIENGKTIFYLKRFESGFFIIVGNATANLGRLRMKLAGWLDHCVVG